MKTNNLLIRPRPRTAVAFALTTMFLAGVLNLATTRVGYGTTTVLYNIRDCFCVGLHRETTAFIAFGIILPDADLRQRQYIVFQAFGPNPPTPGTRITVDGPVRTASDVDLYLAWARFSTDDGEISMTYYGVESDAKVTDIHGGVGGLINGKDPAEYCTRRVDVYELMSFLDSVDFDSRSCYREVVTALGLKGSSDPDDGCGHGDVSLWLWPWALAYSAWRWRH